jgi:cyclic-di-GMP phosphodiesterase, flagellum assembly factor TipF
MAGENNKMFYVSREKPVLRTAIHAGLIALYMSIGLGIGGAAYYLFEYSIGVATCLGGLFALACGLLHLAFTPKEARLSKNEAILIRNEFQSMKKTQIETLEDIDALRDAVVQEARARDQALISELRDLAQMIAQFAARSDAKALAARQPAARIAPKRSDQNLLAAVKAAIAENRVELHIQPIVALPQRKVSFYEGFTRLRDVSGAMILPGEFLRVAEPSGLVNEIDNLLLLRCVQIARQLLKQDRRMGLFCNVSPSSLGDERFFPQFIAFLRENRDLAGSIIFELSREAFDNLPMAAERNMGRLFDLGYRFSIDRCESIDLDLRKLERIGVRYVKIAGDTLVRQMTDKGAMPVTGLSREFEPSDVSSLFARYGVDLIADRVEDEKTVVEILELDIAFAQGNVFGKPRPSGEIMAATNEGPRLRMAG